MIKKLFHRVVVVWCLYGLGRFFVFINPLVFRVGQMLTPFFHKSSLGPEYNETWNSGSGEQIVVLWFIILMGAGVVAFAIAGLHHFSNWFFNTSKAEK